MNGCRFFVQFRKSSKYLLLFSDTCSIVNLDNYLNSPARRQILELLKKGPMSAGEIGSHFDMTGATISYHLKLLKKADLVFETRDKNYIYYQLNTSVLEEIMLWISDLKGGGQNAESK